MASRILSLADLADPAKTPRLVVKVGSSLLVDNGGARREWLAGLVAEIAELAGIALVIGSGLHEAPIARVVQEGIGTLFLPRPGKARQAAARKVWLGGRLRLKGSLAVDAGAANALRQGSSLLARGIIAAQGQFSRGDAVAICDEAGAVLAHGLSEYDAAECAALIGHHSSEHAAILGYAPRSAIVHRDQLVLL